MGLKTGSDAEIGAKFALLILGRSYIRTVCSPRGALTAMIDYITIKIFLGRP